MHLAEGEHIWQGLLPQDLLLKQNRERGCFIAGTAVLFGDIELRPDVSEAVIPPSSWLGRTAGVDALAMIRRNCSAKHPGCKQARLFAFHIAAQHEHTSNVARQRGGLDLLSALAENHFLQLAVLNPTNCELLANARAFA
ncbi:MAG: hypothetical protein ACI9DC_003894 [Gammaproteobacteria bacterium]